jgi:hypothetical protein
LPRPVLLVRFRRRQPQHGGVVRLHLHAPGMPARAENAVDPRQVIQGT